jgi:hypothetical protein
MHMSKPWKWLLGTLRLIVYTCKQKNTIGNKQLKEWRREYESTQGLSCWGQLQTKLIQLKEKIK